MPKANSAAKQARASERKRARNQAFKSRIRTAVSRFQELLARNPKDAVAAGRFVISLVDRAAKVNVIHRNAASRQKAWVMAKLKAAKS